jgi:hypothetical protein
MRISVSRILVVAALGIAYSAALAQTITLVPPLNPITQKYDEGKSCFNFKLGLLKETVLKDTKKNEWDLAYGFLSIGGEDWFTLHSASRSVIQDLGERNWDNPGTVPVLEPLPPFPKGLDASADTHKKWAKAMRNMAKIFPGHMYALHVKNDAGDFYVLFRVNDLEQNKRCTISWQRGPSPEQPTAP